MSDEIKCPHCKKTFYLPQKPSEAKFYLALMLVGLFIGALIWYAVTHS